VLNFEEFSARVDAVVAVGAGGRDQRLVEDLGADSLQTLEVLVLCEDLAGCADPVDEPPAIATLGEAYDYYRAVAQSAAASSGGATRTDG